MDMAYLVAKRSTCLRRCVGCVLINARGHVLSTGYNGVAAGLPHCNEVTSKGATRLEIRAQYAHACPGASLPSGEGLDLCQAIHAEQNALLQCRDVYEIDTAYTTTSPCMTCTKLLLNTSCRRIFFGELYVHSTPQAELWTSSGRVWRSI